MKFFSLIVAICFISLYICTPVKAANPTDEILDYEITVDVDQNTARTLIKYHIEWKVLDSDKAGPLEWLKIGIPSRH